MNHTLPQLTWYSIWKYLSNLPESDYEQEAIALGKAYLEQHSEILNLGLASTISERRQRCDSLLSVSEQAKDSEELKQWQPDLLAAFLFYEDYGYSDEQQDLTNAVELHQRIDALLQNCASLELLKTARATYVQRKNNYYDTQGDPSEPYDEDYWMTAVLKVLEIEKTAFCYASLIWIDEAAVDVCLSETTLTLSQICRSLLTAEDGKVTLRLPVHANLETLPTGMSNLTNIQSLYLYLAGIRYLPEDFCQLSNLQLCHLSVGDLESLPKEIGSLSNLKCLTLENMYKLKDLPSSFSDLVALEELNLINCGFLEVPEPVFQLLNLKKLKICTSSYLKDEFILTSKIFYLTKLKELKIYGDNIYSLPKEIGELTSLEALYISCYNLKDLPSNISNLLNLKRKS